MTAEPFVKRGLPSRGPMFEAEAAELAAIAATGTVRVPQVLDVGADGDHAWITPECFELVPALVADLWSRTHRSRALTFSAESDVVLTRSGLRLRVDGVGLSTTAHRTVTLPQRSEVGNAIPETPSLSGVASTG